MFYLARQRRQLADAARKEADEAVRELKILDESIKALEERGDNIVT